VKEDIETTLGKHPFFLGLKPEWLSFLARCAWNESFTAEQPLFREGEAANTFYVVRAGRVALDIHLPPRGEVRIDTVEAGEVLGVSWLFPPYKWHFDARAVTPTRTTTLDARCLRERYENEPALGYELMKRLGMTLHARLQATRLRLLDIYGSGEGAWR
jgi:CRP-like cAMP-binding protein